MPTLCIKSSCTGCGSCQNTCGKNAILMKEDNEGFLYPIVNKELCVECGNCEKVCPVLHPINFSQNRTSSHAAFAIDNKIRTRGSSGGIFSVLANWVLDNGGRVVGAAYDKDIAVRHIIIDNKKDLPLLQGSKYVQSDLGTVFAEVKQYLNDGRKVLFVGTSCQVAGLLAFLRKPMSNLFTVDLVCHGVPSPKLFAKYISYLKSKDPFFESFSFREMEGWNCNSSSSSRLPNGKLRKNILYETKSGYFSFFINGYMNRECCYQCPYAKSTPRIGDITLADFWGIGKRIPFEHNKKYGVSFVSPNTEKGRYLFDKIRDQIICESRDISETIIEGNNTQLERPAKRPAERTDFYSNAYSMSWENLVNHYNIPLKHRRSFLRRILSKVKHTILG